MTEKDRPDQDNERPTFDDLLRYVSGEESAVKKWTEQIEADREMASDVRLLRRVRGLVAELDLHRIVPAAQELARGVFDSFQTARKLPSDVAAKLYYDSETVPLPQGMRPSLVSERRIRYAVDGGSIEMMIVPEFPGRFEITGQVSTDAEERCGRARLTGRATYDTEFDEFDFFTFASVVPGRYKLTIETNRREIVISSVKL